MSWWANTNGIAYEQPDTETDFPENDAKKGDKERKPGADADLDLPNLNDLSDVGWHIEKDPDSGWIPIAAGPLTYTQALDRCERRTVLDNSGRSTLSPRKDMDDHEPPRHSEGKDEGSNLTNMILQKIVDSAFDNNKGREEDPRMRELEQSLKAQADELTRMREEQLISRFDKIESAIAQLTGRENPEETVRRMLRQQSLGGDSPSVKIITDATDKVDKNVERLTGLLSQIIIKDAFKEENTRTPDQREDVADRLLQQVGDYDRARTLGHRAFGNTR